MLNLIVDQIEKISKCGEGAFTLLNYQKFCSNFFKSLAAGGKFVLDFYQK